MSQDGLISETELTKWDVNEHFVAACAGYYHMLFLTRSGDVYSCGQASYGKLGRSGLIHEHEGMAKITTLSNVRTISAGGYHSIVSTYDGTVYGFGHAVF